MDRWVGRIAVVTGASSGIGAACVKYLANNGMIVIGLARRKERVDALRQEVKPDVGDRIHAIRCDVSKEQDVVDVFKKIELEYGYIAVLVNNAGILPLNDLVSENNSNDLRNTIDTNVMGVAYCTREAFRSMRGNGGNGYVFLINSVAGHSVPNVPGISLGIYPPSKHAVTAMAEIYRQEFFKYDTKVKITSISPGGVDTEIVPEVYKEAAKKAVESPFLQSEDIADALIYCLQTPQRVQILELIIRPFGELLVKQE